MEPPCLLQAMLFSKLQDLNKFITSEKRTNLTDITQLEENTLTSLELK